MSKPDQTLRIGFAIFSALTSFLFVYYAVSVIYGSEASQWLKTFAYVAGGYGLLNIYILSWAWRSRASWTMMANMAIGICMFGVVLVDTFKAGIGSGMHLVGLLGLAFVLGINWFAVKVLCQQPSSRPGDSRPVNKRGRTK